MATKTFDVEVTYRYTIEVNESNPFVSEYENEEELMTDLAIYKFSVLPVIGNGVDILDTEFTAMCFKEIESPL